MPPKDEREARDSAKRAHSQKMKALALANEQYQQLKEALNAAPDVKEKNVIFRRMINLLDVIAFLNSGGSGTSH